MIVLKTEVSLDTSQLNGHLLNSPLIINPSRKCTFGPISWYQVEFEDLLGGRSEEGRRAGGMPEVNLDSREWR